MEFRNNQVLGFGKFLVDVQRLFFFFSLKEKILWSCFLWQDSSAVEIPVEECRARVGDHVILCTGKYTSIHI